MKMINNIINVKKYEQELQSLREEFLLVNFRIYQYKLRGGK